MPRKYSGKLAMFRAMPENPSEGFDRHHGWTDMAVGGVDVVEIRGEHFSFVEEPDVGKYLGNGLKQHHQYSSEGEHGARTWSGVGHYSDLQYGRLYCRDP